MAELDFWSLELESSEFIALCSQATAKVSDGSQPPVTFNLSQRCLTNVAKMSLFSDRPLHEVDPVSPNLEVQCGRVAGGAQFKCQ